MAILKIIGKYALGVAGAGIGIWSIMDGVKTIQKADSELDEYAAQKRAAKAEQEQA